MAREPSSASEVLLSVSSAETEILRQLWAPPGSPPGSLPHPAPFPAAFGGDAGRALRQPASAQVHLDPVNLSLCAVEFGRGKMDGQGFISSD